MRSFRDAEGRRWEVVAGRESWGAIFAIFIPDGEGALRQTLLGASSYAQANEELEGLGESELRELLARSEPKDLA